MVLETHKKVSQMALRIFKQLIIFKVNINSEAQHT